MSTFVILICVLVVYFWPREGNKNKGIWELWDNAYHLFLYIYTYIARSLMRQAN